MRVKICGVTSISDALMVDAAGADAVGLNFVKKSKRFLKLEKAQEISHALGPLINRVGIFVNSNLETIREIAAEVKLDTIQLHGDEDASFAKALNRQYQVIKAVSFTATLDLGELRRFPADAILLDGLKPGGGESFDWAQASFLKDLPRLILAGGLNPDNVAAGIKALQPYAVDVASGVESSAGVKDVNKVRAFIRNARALTN
jgi:phosphoribosylanthranilate isomerase